MRRLDGQRADGDRDSTRRFTVGKSGGPGRPRIKTERACLEAIVERAYQAAGQGNRHARAWLSAYLLGRPEGVASTLHAFAVHELVGTDPVQQDADLSQLLSS